MPCHRCYFAVIIFCVLYVNAFLQPPTYCGHSLVESIFVLNLVNNSKVPPNLHFYFALNIVDQPGALAASNKLHAAGAFDLCVSSSTHKQCGIDISHDVEVNTLDFVDHTTTDLKLTLDVVSHTHEFTGMEAEAEVGYPVCSMTYHLECCLADGERERFQIDGRRQKTRLYRESTEKVIAMEAEFGQRL